MEDLEEEVLDDEFGVLASDDIEDDHGVISGNGFDPGETDAENPPASAPEKAEAAVKNAILENRKWKNRKGVWQKLHNVSDAHTIVWDQIISDGRGNEWQVMSLLWILLQPPLRVIKLGALNVTALRAEVMKFMVAERMPREKLAQVEDALAILLEESRATQVKPEPASDDDDDGDEPGK